MSESLDELNARVSSAAAWVTRLREVVGKIVVGQQYLIDRLLVGLLANGHVLLEGVPGLAKTLAVRTLASAIHATFNRVQFTPDLLPADITGTLIYNPGDGQYHVTKGPVFANIVLADEINRAPAKVQSALLEAMQERQVTLAAKAWALLQGRSYVTPGDVKSIGPDVLRHRVILTYEAEAQGMTGDGIVKRIFDNVPVP